MKAKTLGAARTALLLAFALTSLGSACDDGVEDDEEEQEVDPVTACYDFASAWCNRAVNCAVQVGRLDSSEADQRRSDCQADVVGARSCSAATAVEDDYDKCLSQVRGMACSRWDVPRTSWGSIAPPASCDTALSYE